MPASSPRPSGAPSSMAEGNRKDPRARVLNMTVRYKSATVDEFIENHSHDISRGGIFIKTRSPFPAGTLLNGRRSLLAHCSSSRCASQRIRS
jgi:hypothetical protein